MHCAFKNTAAFELRRNAEDGEDGAVESVIVGEGRLNQGFPPTRENAMQAGSPDRVDCRGGVTSGSKENGGNVTRPRAADDFPLIRARMEELRREGSQPRAADDFAMIRARMEELRRERARVAAEARRRSVIHRGLIIVTQMRDRHEGRQRRPT